MRFFTILFTAASAGFVAAQCGGAISDLVDACLLNMDGQTDLCRSQDYTCLCAAWTKIAACYNQCPTHPDAFGATQNQQQNCQFAKEYEATATTAKVGKVTAAPTVAPISSTMSMTKDVPKTGLGGDTEQTSSPDLSAPMGIPVGGALAIVLGIAGLL